MGKLVGGARRYFTEIARGSVLREQLLVFDAAEKRSEMRTEK